jgi:GT2 family glycosyltransferase/glycosyltransferase involved in cell wall biosynthesis
MAKAKTQKPKARTRRSDAEKTASSYILRIDRGKGLIQFLSIEGDPVPAVTLKIDGALDAEIRFEQQPAGSALDFNLLADPALENFKAHWLLQAADPVPGTWGTDLAPEWTLKRSHTAYAGIMAARPRGIAAFTYQDPAFGPWLPVSADLTYEFGCLAAAHRCSGMLVAEFQNGSGGIRAIAGEEFSASFAGGPKLDGYYDARLKLNAKPGETSVRLGIRKSATTEGTDSFIFFAAPRFGLSGVRTVTTSLAAAKDEPCRSWILRNLADGKAIRARTYPLPKVCYDGNEHVVELATPAGAPVCEPEVFRATTASHGTMDLGEGFELRCDLGPDFGGLWRPCLKIDDDVIGAVADLAENVSGSQFTLAIPTRYLDGCPHVFAIATEDGTGDVMAATAGISACYLTPWTELARHSALPLPIGRSARAVQHLENLRLLHRGYRDAQKTGDTQAIADLAAQLQDAAFAHTELETPWDRRTGFPSLRFSRHAIPRVSIVIPCHNKWNVTYHCLLALKFAYNRASFEVIVVDDQSEDATRTIEAVVEGITVVRNPQRMGFVGSCNAGAAAARGRYFVFLNNDTEPAGGWLDRMLALFELYPAVGLVGSKLVYPDGKLQEAGGIVWASGDPANYGRMQNAEDPRYCYVRQADYVSGASLMIGRAVWEQVGGFTADFAPGYFEDTDLAFKVREAGYLTLYAPHSVVVHYEGMSNGNWDNQNFKSFQEKNRPKFKSRWSKAFAAFGDAGGDPDLEKDRNVGLRCLMVDYQLPRPDIDAGSYAAIQEIRLLQSLGCKITFVPQNLAYLGGYAELLQQMGVEVVYAPFALSINEILTKRGSEFDFVYVTRYGVLRRIADDVRALAPGAKLVLNVADLHYLRELRQARASKPPAPLDRVEAIRAEEIDAISRSDLCLTYSQAEKTVIEGHRIAQARCELCPWVVETGDAVQPFEGRRHVAFLGNFNHPPNLLGVRFFVDEVMPLLAGGAPQAKFLVYGSGVTDELRALASDRVEIEGWVEDVAEVYQTTRVFVSPLLSGAGIKGKVISALAFGVPQVLTSIAAEGTGIRDGVEAFIADKPEDFARATAELYGNPARWEAMSAAALELAAERYSFEAGRAMMKRALDSIGILTSDRPGLTVTSADVNRLMLR